MLMTPDLAKIRAALDEHGDAHRGALARQLNLSRKRFNNLVRLTRLPDDVLDLIGKLGLTLKHAEAVAALRGTAKQMELLRQAGAGRWSSDRLRQAVAKAKGRRVEEEPHPDADMAALERRLSDQLGTQVRIEHKADGTGELRLRYTDLDTLDGLLQRLGYSEA
ncbi:hypothetical protein VDS42_19130 [Xanthomonas campestris pv. campestris]|nr:hypothetical protein [Xanthomonas campestris pv. campestris]